MRNSNRFIQGILNSNEEIITEVYASFFPKVENFVLQNKGQREDAEDVFQKALLQISVRIKLRKLEIIHTSFEAYLFTACKNLWRRELNKCRSGVTNEGLGELVSDESDMAYALLEQERWELYKEKFELLSENCKQILVLFLKKVPYSKIMKQLSYSSEIVVRQRVFKCKSRIIKIIKSDSRFRELK